MPQERRKRKRLAYLFIAVAIVSLFSFTYLNLCVENTSMVSHYMGDISYSEFRLEQIVLPDLHFFESGFQRIIDIIFARA